MLFAYPQGGCITVQRGLEGFRASFASPTEVTLRFFADDACDDGEQQRYTQLTHGSSNPTASPHSGLNITRSRPCCSLLHHASSPHPLTRALRTCF